jgi:hypothetical protein
VAVETVRRHLERLTTHRHVWSHTRTGHEWIRRIWQHDYENPPAIRLRNGRLTVHRVALPPRALPAHLLA